MQVYRFATYSVIQKQFQMTPSLLASDISSNPNNPASVLNKVKFYEQEIGLKPEHIKNLPVLLKYDCTSDERVPTSIKNKLSNKINEILADLAEFVIDNWEEEQLIRHDRLHFTHQGYELLGDLLYNALLTDYLTHSH